METREKSVTTIDLTRIFHAFKVYYKGIIGWSVIGLIVTLAIATFFVTPKYSSTVDLLVNQKADNTQAQYATQQADLGAINTYKDVLKKSVILNPVLKEQRKVNNYRGSLGSLQNSVEISNAQDSQVIGVNVKDKNAYVAADIANNIADEFTKKIKKMMKVDNVTIVTKARADNKAVSPNKKLFSLVGIALGFLIGVAIALLREFLNNTIQDDDMLKDELGLVSLGHIYHIKKDDHSFRAVQVIQNNHSGENGVGSFGRRRV